jgi:tetratricopeptide (TPR) repeat protein
MPSTINGIGTHYYGKKNRVVRTALCEWCKQVRTLESYDTRLWFVIAFIPVFSLGRKRVIDQCPGCTRHRVANADTYEQARQLQTSGSMDRYRREPSPETALVAHGQLLSFHEHEQAAQFRKTVLERFPDRAELRAGLATQLRQASAFDAAAALYQEALRLQPDLPEARIGVALRMMALGELDKARGLLDFLEAPGAGQHYSLDTLDRLASCYQGAGRHEEAFGIAEHILREIPQAGQHRAFRSFVRKSEKALGRRESILPPLEHTLRGLFRAEGSPYPTWLRRVVLGGVGLILLAAGLLINNEYIRRHRTVHVVNACEVPVRVQVDDGPPETVDHLGRLTLSEGRHTVRLSGPVDETREIDVGSGTGFIERWSHKPVWVLNPGGEAVLDEATLYYAKNPRPVDHHLLVGESFVVRPHVDYAFVDAPASMDVKSRDGEIVKTALRRVDGMDDEAYLAALQTDRPGARTFAERRLRRHPGQSKLLLYYFGQTRPDERARVEAFLKSGLDHRPVVIEWHRAYQQLVEDEGQVSTLMALYDDYLKSDPASGALLYLRGRIDPDWDSQEAFYERSIEADARLPWPWMALAIRAASEARWDECLKDLNKARELQIDPDLIRERLHTARIATGDAERLVSEYRARLQADTTDLQAMVDLGDALAVAGHPEEIEPALVAMANHLPWQLQNQWNGPLRAIARYQAGKFAECEQFTRNNLSLRSGALHAQSLLALGRAGDVASDKTLEQARENPWLTLAVSLGLSHEGRPDESDRWRVLAVEKLESLNAEARKVAKILRAEQPVPIEQITRVLVDADEKALLLAVLAGRFPERKSEYRAAAARYNVLRKPPYELLRRVLEAAPSPVP